MKSIKRLLFLCVLSLSLFLTCCKTKSGNNAAMIASDTAGFVEKAGVVADEDGYYISPALFGLDLMFYYEKSSGVCIPVCSKADCTHSDETCNAYTKGISVYTPEIENGSIYYWALKGFPCLMKMAPDGTGQETVYRFTENGWPMDSVISDDWCFLHVMFAQDVNGSDVDGLYCFSLSSNEKPVLISMNNDDKEWPEHRMNQLFVDNGKAYYSIQEYRDRECRSRVYCFDPETNENSLLFETPHIIRYALMKGKLVYSCADTDTEETYIVDLEDDHIDSVLPYRGIPTYDGHYLYLTNYALTMGKETGYCHVYNDSLEKIDSFSEEGGKDSGYICRVVTETDIVFFYDDKIPLQNGGTEDILVYHIYPKEQIGVVHEPFVLVLDSTGKQIR